MSVLAVPYYVQPTTTTCQSTCLKMFAAYLDKRLGRPAGHRDISGIQRDLKTHPDRPNKATYNSYDNYVWWLKREFGDGPDFTWKWISRDGDAVRWLIQRVQAGYPAITSNKVTSSGHVILVVGVRGEDSAPLVDATRATPAATRFVCHDPGGHFEPGKKSWHADRFL